MSFNKASNHVVPIALDNRGRTIPEPSLDTERHAIKKNFSEDEDYLDDTANHIKFEFSIEYDKLQHYMANEFKIHQGSEPAWISGTIDRQTLKMTSVKLGRRN